jgi:XTP/dITP diphosphohydrolase
MKKIAIASANKKKLAEIMEIVEDLPFEFVPMSELLGYTPDIPENGETFLQNAMIKANWVFEKTGMWTLADDSGLEVDALCGAPGVYSARYAGTPVDSHANNEKLLRDLTGVAWENRTARFRCVIVVATGPGAYLSAEGICNGHIITEYRGCGGFGYDPLFIPDGSTVTFAELDAHTKHSISHRGSALRKIKQKMEALDGHI